MNPVDTLQWGHVFSDVETIYQIRHVDISAMLQWGHVFSDVETTGTMSNGVSVYECFNGATSFQTWKRRELNMDNGTYTALQWGHVFSDVETNKSTATKMRVNHMLQWGHVFSDVETSIRS